MPDQLLDLDSLLALVTEVTGVAPIGADDNFFDLGGDSLHAAHLAVLLDEEWDLLIDVMLVATTDTLRDLYEGILDSRTSPASF